RPDDLLAWLEPAVAGRDDLAAEPLTIQRELGRDSLAWGRARNLLEILWRRHHADSEVALKRQLWDGLLREVYGTEVGDDRLFLQHTYLTIVAKTIAARVLDLDLARAEAADILSGRAIAEIGIHGAVESDFFDWILADAEGRDLVLRLARQTARFRLRDAQADVLKALYESLIDPTQRHDLGEYYTPDWLAFRLVRAAVKHPLTDRVLDPACGSGTFPFHAIRHLREAAAAAGWTNARAVAACAEQVRGLDIHPVAVIIARVTWLLALGDAIVDRPANLHVPVFLGDALQWNVSTIGDSREVQVRVPDDRPLHIPAGFAEAQERFEPGLRTLSEGLTDNASPAQVEASLRRIAGVSAADAAALGRTFAQLQTLYRAGRNGIWPFVLRNLVRPLWLSRPDQRADVVIGNPPWVAYRHLSPDLKARFKDACQRANLWIGGKLATQQDLSALFVARATERYLKPDGTLALVLPYAALNRPAYEGMRRGDYGTARLRIDAAWSFDETVQPLFPVPASVIIARRASPQPLPATVTRYTGHLPRRD
ncbi:MAG: N-6 DNA methylase, partial [Rhodospirillales bacterium]|nr:N-6 DNA methylase [Rhodospirillales bacterium]